MKEVELKYFDVDADQILARLESLGAQRVFDDVIEAFYFDRVDTDQNISPGVSPAAELAQRHQSLRLRREGSRTVLTHKFSRTEGQAKVAEETQTVVEDFDAMRQIIENLGYRVVLRLKKHRISYCLPGQGGAEEAAEHCEIERHIDDQAHIPVFIELEAQSLPSVKALAEKLGLDPSRGEALNAFDVLARYSK